MKRILITSTFIFLYLNLFSQLFKTDKSGEEFFILGLKQLEIGDFKSADSLYSLALCTYKNENVYYNRGIARLCVKDTIGFCADMNIASNKYLDNEAEKIFTMVCCNKVDTFYYDKKMKIASKEKFKYYEVIQEHKYEKEIIGKIHEVNANSFVPYFDVGCTQDLIRVGGKPTDIVGMYEMIDSIKYFYYANIHAVVELGSRIKYENMKKQITDYFNMKYGELKQKNQVEKISIHFKIYLSEKGEVTFAKYLGTFPEINLFDKEKEFIMDIEKYIKNYPKVTPSAFQKKNVSSIVMDFVEY